MIDDIASFLATNGFGTVGTDIFEGWQPSSPDNCTSVFQTGGNPMDLAATIDYPSFQIRVRDLDYDSGASKAESIGKLLHGITEQDIGANHYLLISAMQSPTSLGLDSQNRNEWTQNFNVIKRRS